MFPKLNVSEAENHGGGPRAPPRNKMALYEQVGMPSSRLSIGLTDVSCFPTPSDSILVASMPSTHSGGDHQRNMFASFLNSPAQSSYLSEKSLLYSTCGDNQLNSMTTSKDWKPMKHTSFQSLDTISQLPACNFSDFNDLCLKTDRENKHHHKVTSCSSSQPGIGETANGNDWENFPQLSLNSSMHFEKHMKGTKGFDLKLTHNINNQGLDIEEVPRNSRENLGPMPSKLSCNGQISSPLIKSSLVNTLNYLAKRKACSYQERTLMQDETVLKDSFLTESNGVGKENGLSLRNEQCNNNFASMGIGSDCAPVNVRDLRRHGDISDSSWVDSRPVSRSGVVGVLGEKQYWKARDTIANQQRIFALQVFELHRLIKVQKMIAGSPRLFLEDNNSHFLGKSSLQSFLMKKSASDYIGELPAPIKLEDLSQKSNDNAVPKLLLPPQLTNNSTSKEFVTNPQSYDPKPSPWCLMPSRNQWLVPVMSPSEGLIYKPYNGPCPPPAGLASSVYQTSAPTGGDFLSSGYGVPSSHKQNTRIFPSTSSWSQTYSPNSDQASMFPGTRSRDNQISIGDVEFTRPIQNLGNRLNQINRTSSCYFGQIPENEVLGNTTTICSQRAAGDELQLFPTEPTTNQNAETNKQASSQVIKAVPRNPMSASESTARIFRSIQEQRKKL
ncbi:hypothetical protein ACFE04_008602 [Oxalis oulophora]